MNEVYIMQIKGKVAVITGASSGIGAVIARLLHKEGATVILTARNVEKIQVLAAELRERVEVYEMDVSNAIQVKETFQTIANVFGRVDILINNAGFGVFAQFEQANLHDFEAMMAVNYMGLVNCTYQVLPGMKARGHGSIVNIASLAGKVGTAKSSGYAATKHAVLGFTNSLRMELRGSGVHVGAVNPGPVDTNFFAIADPNGNYVNSIRWMMLTPHQVALAVEKVIRTERAEIDLPKWMGFFTKIYALAPRFFDLLTAGIMNRK
jgi:uncharacterized protein